MFLEWDGIQGIKRIYDEKEKAKDREQLEAYLKIYESWEKRKLNIYFVKFERRK